jgi:hypothetical protein
MASSRPYKVTTKQAIGKALVAEDHVKVRLDIPPILPKEQTGAILADVLKRRGFGEGGDGSLIRERGGVKVVIDPEEGTMTVSSEAETTLPPSNPSPCSCRARASLTAEAAAHSDLQRQVTRRLEGAVARLGCEVEGVIHQVTKEALKQKAAQLGTIKEITEDPKNGNMTIVVEV